MKQVFLLAILIVCSSAMAQINLPLVEEGKVWCYKGFTSNVDDDDVYYKMWEEIYSLEGDTVIGSRQCLRLYLTCNSPYKHYDHSYIGAMYEESGKVYYIAPDNTTSTLLYDFSCDVGDIVEMNLYEIYYPKIVKWDEFELIINGKQLVKYRDKYLTVINWSPIYDTKVVDFSTIWIEDVGSPIDLLNSTTLWYTGGYSKELLTCKLNGQIIYDKDEFQTSAQYIREDEVTFTAGQMATIILPTEPEAGRGKYYRLDRVEGNEIVFEQELHPAAHVPYIIVPSEDFIIDVNTLDLEGCYRDTAFVDGISFIGSFVSEELDEPEGSCIDIIDTTPDCGISSSGEAGKRVFLIGALRAYLLVSGEVHDELSIVLRDKTTSVQSIQNSKKEAHSDVYDLSGRKFMDGRKLPRGIYIEDGRKKVKLRP